MNNLLLDNEDISNEEYNELICEKLKDTYIDLLAIRIVNKCLKNKENKDERR